MRIFSPLLLLLALFGPARAAELRSFDDASLRSLHFVDDKEGWAVGDEGVIWHTIDSGKSWERQSSGVSASLRSVQFTVPYDGTGWIAGREELPGGRSAGVVLYTRDGGVEWRRILVDSLPGLELVRFVGKTGYLAGDGSDAFPSGVFATTDGGRSWAPVPGPRTTAYRAGDFNAEGGAMAGAWNRLATLRRGQVFAIDMDSLGGRSLGGLQLRGEDAVAVGQGGLILLSNKTRGSSWNYADVKLSREVREQFDFHAVGGVGSEIWAVGRPGSAMLHSRDMGKTWEMVPTGQSMPLHAVWFADAKKGWAAGELGTVLATTDGGKTWTVQRRGGQRLAVLFVHSRAKTARLETMSLLCGQEGYFGAGLCVASADPSGTDLARCAESARFARACRRAGAVGGEVLWTFPISSHQSLDRDSLLTSWNKAHDGNADMRLLSQLVLAVRMYQPDVIITDRAGDGVEGAESLVSEALREAFRRASDPKSFPEQLTSFHLSAHKPKKLYAVSQKNQANVAIDLTTWRSRLSSSLREFVAGPNALLDQNALSSEVNYRLLADDLPGADAHKDLMQAINLAPGGFARREIPAESETSEAEMKLARKREQLWAIADAPPSELTNPERLLGQLTPMLAEMPEVAGVRVADSLAKQYLRRGQWTLARETYSLLSERYPTHPMTIDAYRWLIQHQSSSEARRRHEMGQFIVYGENKFVAGGTGVSITPQSSLLQKNSPIKIGEFQTSRQETTRGMATMARPDEVRQGFQNCLAWDKKLSAFGPLHATEPVAQFALQAARRQLGDPEEAQRWYRGFVANQPAGPWRDCAAAELWLSNRTGNPPKPILGLRSSDARPYLDGKLDDPCWANAKVVKLQAAKGDSASRYPTEVRMSYDADFLYFAVRCGKPAEEVLPTASKRTRDENLSRFDRISLTLDLDRDYSTAFQFQIDCRGCMAEDCWGDSTWNPRWFVATKQEPTAWTAEVAIPRMALTADGFSLNKTWAMNVVRVLPGQGVQAFSLPAEAPESAQGTGHLAGMGLLTFTGEAKESAERKSK